MSASAGLPRKSRKRLSNSLRFRVFTRDGFRCMYCGASPPDTVLEVDHVLPVTKGGDNELSNLKTACRECNRGKYSHVMHGSEDVQREIARLEEAPPPPREVVKTIESLSPQELQDVEYIANSYASLYGEKLPEIFNPIVARFLKDFPLEELAVMFSRACEKKPENPGAVVFEYCMECTDIIRARNGLPPIDIKRGEL